MGRKGRGRGAKAAAQAVPEEPAPGPADPAAQGDAPAVDSAGSAQALAGPAAPPLSANASRRQRRRARKGPKRRTLRRLMGYLRPQWKVATLTTMAIILSSLLDLAQPYILGFLLFGEVLAKSRLSLLPVVIALMAGAFVAKEVTSFMKDYWTQTLSERVMHKLRSDVYRHTNTLPLKLIDRVRTGELVSRVIGDTEEVEKVMTVEVSGIGADAVMFVGALSLMFYVNFELAKLVVPVALAIVVVVNISKRMIKRSSKRIRESVADLTSRAFEVASGIRMVKSSAREAYEGDQFQKQSSQLVAARVRLARLSGVYGSGVDALTMAATLAFIWLMVPGVVAGVMTIGALVAFLGYADKMFKPLVSLSKVNIKIQKAVAAGERIFELLDAEGEVLNAPGSIAPDALRGQIIFERVNFGYRVDRPVLKSFTAAIDAGETVAIVGASGTGKSTVVNLLLRFYEPTSGRILLDGRPVQEYGLGYLRGKIGLVQQDPVLFAGTVRENIAYGKEGATIAEVVKAARQANAHDFIMGLPQAYDTQVGERGTKLSVGQRQRVAIARALVKDPPILVFDEATSNLDSESEGQIKEALRGLVGGRTMIIIAHRLSSIIDADRIIVLEKGTIVESGSSEDLTEKKGAFARLYEGQVELRGTSRVVPPNWRSAWR